MKSNNIKNLPAPRELTAIEVVKLLEVRDQLGEALKRGGEFVPAIHDSYWAMHGIFGPAPGEPAMVPAPPPAILEVTSSLGIIFKVRIIQKGDNYGTEFKLTYDAEEPQVEFYDTRHPHTEFGQFVSRYYAKTLLGDDAYGSGSGGLDLQGGVATWKIDEAAMDQVRSWVRARLGRPAEGAL